ncbi:MAG TPA: hypothetical protein V6D29_13210 [Leptolyngbyaceae cyanobacterium]
MNQQNQVVADPWASSAQPSLEKVTANAFRRTKEDIALLRAIAEAQGMGNDLAIDISLKAIVESLNLLQALLDGQPGEDIAAGVLKSIETHIEILGMRKDESRLTEVLAKTLRVLKPIQADKPAPRPRRVPITR